MCVYLLLLFSILPPAHRWVSKHFFYKALDRKCSRLWGPCDHSHKYSTIDVAQNSHIQYVNELVWLDSEHPFYS